MADGIFTTIRKAIYSPNLLPATSVFDSSVVINKLVGVSGCVLGYDSTDGYIRPYGAIKAYNVSNSTSLLFNVDTNLAFVAQKTGTYYLSLELKHNMPLTEMYADTLIVYIKANGVQVHEMQCILAVDDTENQIHYPNTWGTYSQRFNLSAGNTIDFQFKLITNPLKPLSTSLVWLDALKFEFDDRALDLPSIYSKPL